MHKRFLISILVAILLTITLSSAYAAPDKDSNVDIFVWPRYWQWEEAKEKNNGEMAWKNDAYAGRLLGEYWKPFYKNGCLVSSLSMLFNYYGLSFIPDYYHNTELCKDTEFSNYCSERGILYSETDPGNLNRWLTDNEVYQNKWLIFDYLLAEEVMRRFWRYKDEWGGKWAIRPNFKCYPIGKWFDEGCYKVDWSDPMAQQLLDEDLKNKRPDIMKIKWTDKDGDDHDNHFVLIGGYDWDKAASETSSEDYSPEDYYRAYDPNVAYSLNKSQYGRYMSYPPSLKELYEDRGSNHEKLRLDRFTGDSFYFEGFWKHVVSILGLSPIELQVINQNGKTTGYDPATRTRVVNIPKTSYSEESEPSIESDSSEDPAKVLFMNVSSGNYILKIYGTGEGEYTVKIRNIGDDEITELDPITGTASTGMTETYRLQIPSTGEITLSNTNQSPTANAGTDQTGEQSYEITLDGSGSSDPDGDPLKYTWSFISKPSGSTASLSDSSSKTPTFTPDLQGTYVIQLVVNDYFTDSSPSTVTLTVTPIQSRISVTPNFSTPLSAGSSSISFDLNNIGRLNVASGLIDMTLKDPDGNVISTGSKTFTLSTGQSMTVSIPVTIPSLKFGNYSLIYSQSDETKTGSSTTTTVVNSVSAAFTFDKTSYKVRETANLTLDLTNTGKFNLDPSTGSGVSVSVNSVGYTNTQTVSVPNSLQLSANSSQLTYSIPIPETTTAGQHDVNVTLMLPSGSSTTQSSQFTIPDSSLNISYSGATSLTAGETINLKIENTGGVDTSYTTEKLSITDSKGITIYEGNPSGTIQAGQIKTLADIQIPSQTISGSAFLDLQVKDDKTSKVSNLYETLEITGFLTASLQTNTDKDVYLNTEAIIGISTILNGQFGIENGSLKITVSGMKTTTGEFHTIVGGYGNKAEQFSHPVSIAASLDGYIYVAEAGNCRVQKLDGNGNFVTKWGSYGSGNGQFAYPQRLAISSDGFIYVADFGNNRIQKFDGNGSFITVWGSKGSSDGQFRGPDGIAVGTDGSVYVADTYNHRIQKFDSNGNFITKWGSYGSGDGQLNHPFEVGTSADGYIYVADTGNNRIQKFDSNGNFVTKWGSYGSGNGQFAYLYGEVNTDIDGFVYVADTGNNRIQKFDSNGNFIARWGSYGSGDGQFKYPRGIVVDSNGSVYVADTYNHRIQKMTPATGGTEKLFETTIPITQSANTSQDYTTNIGTLNTTGKLYLNAELKNSLGQTIATDEYPFYIVEGNTVLSFSADKKVYKPNETVTITGEVQNLSSITASALSLQLSANSQNLYNATFDVPANSSHPFTITTTFSTEGTYTLTGKVTQSNSTLVEINDQYEVAQPKATTTVTMPEVVGNEAFDINVEMKNEGKIEANVDCGMRNAEFENSQQITIPAGETKTLQYSQQITGDTTYTFTFTGDLEQTVTKTVAYGLGVSVSASVSEIYPEGRIAIPITITNTGQLDTTIDARYTMQDASNNIIQDTTKTYYIPKGTSTTDTLYYDLTEGSYQLSAVSYQPSATTTASFSVIKENKVDMTVSAGQQTNSMIPVTATLTNKGYNDITGSIAVSVIDNQEKVIWRGETEVSALKSQTSSNYTVNVNTTGMTSGAYKTSIVLYSSSGLQLASSETQIRVLGPIFEITSLPEYPAFTAGKEATLSFTVKNTGTLEGTTSFSVKAMDVLNQSITESLKSGEEKSFTFNFTVPEDSEEKDYYADYTLTPVNSQGTSGQVKFHVNQVKVEVTASLDKEAYKDGDTALVTLTISKLSQTEDGTYMAIVRYRSNPVMQSFMLTSQPTMLTFSVPLSDITGEDIFYSVHFESGNTIYQNTMAINMDQPDLTTELRTQNTDSGTQTIEVSKDNTLQITATVTNQGKMQSDATTISLYDSDPSTSSGLIETKSINTLNSGESQEVILSWNVLGKAGEHTIKAVVDPDNSVTEFNEENNTAETSITVPDINLTTETDKDTYKIRQKVNINSMITNLTSATTYNNLTITTSAKDPSGNEVYKKNTVIETIQPSSTVTHTEAWNTSGLQTDGSYTITQTIFREGDPEGSPYTQNSKLIALEKAPDFTLSIDTDHQKIKQGEKATYTAYLESVNGWNTDVTLDMEGLPSGASVSFNPGSFIPPGESVTMIITTDATTAGTYNLNLIAEGIDEGETVTHTQPLTLDISGFELSSEQSSQTIKQLETATFEINIASINGYEGEVTLDTEEIPYGIKASMSNDKIQIPNAGKIKLTVLTSKYARPGTYTLTITGDDGLVKHNLNLSLTIEANPEITAGIITAQGTGPNNTAEIKVFNSTIQIVMDITAFDTKYGAYAIGADIDGDGYDEIIVSQGPDPKNTATLKAFKQNGTLITEYTAFDTKYGLTLSSGDIDGDWKDELIVGMGPDPKNPATMKILKYNGTEFDEIITQTVSDTKHGLNTTTGDIDGDGIPEIITAPGPGPNNPAKVTIWKYSNGSLTEYSTITAFDGYYGANITSGDIDGDGKAEIITGTGTDPKNSSIVRAYKPDGTLVMELKPYDEKYGYGVTVASGDINGDGIDDIITGLGPGPQNNSWVKVFSSNGSEIYSFTVYPEDVKYGVRVSSGRTGE